MLFGMQVSNVFSFSFPIHPHASLVPLSKKNADQSDGIPEREERSAVHGRAVGAAAERAGEWHRHPGDLHSTEERGDQETHGNLH